MLDNRIERESKLIRKHSVTVLAEKTFQSSLNHNMVQGEIPTDPTELTLYDVGAGVEIISTENPPSYKFVNEVKSEVKLQILSNENEKHYDHSKSLVKQGNFCRTYILHNWNICH